MTTASHPAKYGERKRKKKAGPTKPTKHAKHVARDTMHGKFVAYVHNSTSIRCLSPACLAGEAPKLGDCRHKPFDRWVVLSMFDVRLWAVRARDPRPLDPFRCCKPWVQVSPYPRLCPHVVLRAQCEIDWGSIMKTMN